MRRRNCHFKLWTATMIILVVVVMNLLLISTMFSSSAKEREFSKEDFVREDFPYPLDIDLLSLVDKIKRGLPTNVEPINDPKFTYLHLPKNSCTTTSKKVGSSKIFIDLLIVIKSRVENFARRALIRRLWGNRTCWSSRFAIERVFSLGATSSLNLQRKVDEEFTQEGDLLQQNFLDSYYNTTYKNMMAFQWIAKYCGNARDILFVDEDRFIYPRGIVRYLSNLSDVTRRKLLAGFVQRYPPVIRNPNNKWFVSYKEYPWERYPTFISGGAILVSAPILRDISIAMPYTAFIKLDDVFLGIIYHKLLFLPMHLKEFYNTDIDLKLPIDGRVLVAHGFNDSTLLEKAWLQSDSAVFCRSKIQTI